MIDTVLHELWSAGTAAAADRHTMQTLAVPSILLMERASLAVAHEVRELLGGTKLPIHVLVGPGNNGGDGLAVARILRGWGFDVDAALVTTGHNDAVEQQLGMARAAGVRVHDNLLPVPEQRCVVIDGMLGTGATGAPRGGVLEGLRWSAEVWGPKVAIDLPSGVDPDHGTTYGPAFVANLTVTFVRSKPGLHVTPGLAHAGRVVVADIGISAPLGAQPAAILIGASSVWSRLRRLPAVHHKGDRGHVAVYGGSAHTPGAAVLSGTTAMRCGAGVVTIATHDPEVRHALLDRRPELMVADPDDETMVPAADALVVGPGLTDATLAESGAASRLRELWSADPRPALWDASALVHVPADHSPAGPRIVTPHPGEAARMLAAWEPDAGWTTQAVQARRLDVARLIAKRSRAVVVLKGEGSVVARPSGLVAIATVGSAALATAGSGDALAGLGGALLARGLSAEDAADIAVFVHGLAGDRAQARFAGPLASEIGRCCAEILADPEPPASVRGWPRSRWA